MTHWRELFETLIRDPDYLKNLDWGRPRRGHPEGTVRAHIAELEQNLETLRGDLSQVDYLKLLILVHVHDSFKAEAKGGVAITDARSHASLATAFLKRYCDDTDLLNMCQFHDEPYALWRQHRGKGRCNQQRLQSLLAKIKDWRLFIYFLLIDNGTVGKDPEPLHWALLHLARPNGLEQVGREAMQRLQQKRLVC